MVLNFISTEYQLLLENFRELLFEQLVSVDLYSTSHLRRPPWELTYRGSVLSEQEATSNLRVITLRGGVNSYSTSHSS